MNKKETQSAPIFNDAAAEFLKISVTENAGVFAIIKKRH